MNTIADKLRKAIAQAERRGITRYKIAQDAGVSRANITMFMNGASNPRLDTAEALAGALGIKFRLTKGRR